MTQTCDRCGNEVAVFVVIKEFEERLCVKCFLEEQGVRRAKQLKLFEEVDSDG